MPTVNERLLDAAVGHQIDLQRYSTGVVRRIIALLNRADADLIARIAEALTRVEPSALTIERLEALLSSVRELNAQAYRVAYGAIPGEMSALADYETDWQLRGLQAAFPADARALIVFNRVSGPQAYAAAMARPFQGGLLREWATSGEQGRMKAVRDTIRLGYLEGRTTDEIIRTIRGTRARQFKDGLLDRSRRSVETMVRTALSHTASTAREEVYRGNSDVIKAIGWVSTLDGRTSPMCRVRDGLRYSADEAHKPIGHKVPWLQGPGRVHFGCRSTSAPVTKSFRELGIDIDEISPATRASMDGQVPADLTYGQWIGRQSAARQDEILGPERGALLRSGGLDHDQFYSPRGDFLTLEELRAKDARAFELAGLDNAMRPVRGTPQDQIAAFLSDPDAQRALLESLYKSGAYPPVLAPHLDAVTQVATENGWKAAPLDLAGVRYQTGQGFAAINKRMREGPASLEDRQYTALVSRGVDDLPRYQGPIWRAPAKRAHEGEAWWNRAVIGEPLDLGNQLTAFSSDPSFATTWSVASDVLIHIRRPSRGAYIEEITLNTGEDEVLLPAGLRYRVVAKRTEELEDRDGKQREMRVIEVEIVGD